MTIKPKSTVKLMVRMFGPALEALETSGQGWLSPQSFQAYLTKNKLPKAKTVEKISIQSIGRLDKELLDANVMVFRLGTAVERTAQFALVRAEKSVAEFFLTDCTIPDKTAPKKVETFVPETSVADLFPFELLGTLTETGAVNLALASGLLGYALGCDQPFPRIAPATGASTYHFDVRPHRRLPEVVWKHAGGQVEIDAVCFGRRDGRRTLFVIEAKHGAPHEKSGLAKTKLVYPCSAIASKGVPADIPIVPVYLRSWATASGRKVRFCVKECGPWDQASNYVSDLDVVSSKLFEMAFG